MSNTSIIVTPYYMGDNDNETNLNEKIIHFQRHATGWHNVHGETKKTEYLREDLEDATLSDGGLTECSAVPEGSASGAQLLLVSPMRRTLQTASLSFPHLVNQIPWLAQESLREVTGMHPCDRRLPIPEHAETHSHVDFSLVEDIHDPMYQKYTDAGTREPDPDVMVRCEQFLSYLQTRRETEIVVCTHSAYLRVLFNKIFADQAPEHCAKYKNCEIRSYTLAFLQPQEEEKGEDEHS
jgi:broad specificity phosphatase PhoE